MYLTFLITELIKTTENREVDGIEMAYIYEMLELLEDETDKFKKEIKDEIKSAHKDNYDLEIDYTTQNLKDIGVDADLTNKLQTKYKDVKSKKIDKLVDKQINKLTKEIKSQLLNMVNTQDINEVTNLLETYLEKEKSSQSLVNKLMRIYRTESTEMRSETKLEIQRELKELGIPVKRRWVHTLYVASNVVGDNYTPREDHLMLNGVEEDDAGYFHTSKADGIAPGMFGLPEEDINCRCDVEFVLDE